MEKTYLFLLVTFVALSAKAQKDSVSFSPDTLNQSAAVLNPVTVRTSTYKADSLQRRKEYEDIFNFQKTRLSMGNNKWSESIVVMGKKIALDTRNKKLSLLNINSLAHVISSKKEKKKSKLQKRLTEDENSWYVEQFFTPALVEKYSGIHNDDSLHLFINTYSPSYNDIISMNDLDLGMYIIEKIKLFRQNNLHSSTSK